MFNNFYFVIACVLLLSCGCKYYQGQTFREQNKVASETTSVIESQLEFGVNEKVCSTFDTTINGRICLMNSESIVNAIGDIYYLLEMDSTGAEYIYFQNLDSTKYLKMFPLPGGVRNTMIAFELGYNHQKTGSMLKCNDFETNTGIHLGLDLDHVKAILGEPRNESHINGELFVQYYCIESMYFYNLVFKSNNLMKIHFGYINP